MRVFLTGASGYVGTALARRLAADGHEVRALVRATSTAEPLKAPGVQLFVGDVCDRPSMVKPMTGADWVIHAAAVVYSTDWDRMFQTNVVGSENVASLACRLGVKRFLSVSSMSYFGGSPADGSLGTETMEPLQPFPTYYASTKHAGEKAIRKWIEHGLWVNTVYPTQIYGPPGRLFLRQILDKSIPVVVGPGIKMSLVYLPDLVDGMLKVLEKAPAGRDYLMAGDVTTARGLTNRVCRLGGVRPPWLSIPMPAVSALVRLSTPLFKKAGRRPPLAIDELPSLERHWAFDDSRARTELGWTPRSLDEGMPPTIEAMLAAGRA